MNGRAALALALTVALLLCHGLLGVHHLPGNEASPPHETSHATHGGEAPHDHDSRGTLELCAEYFAALFKTFSAALAGFALSFALMPLRTPVASPADSSSVAHVRQRGSPLTKTSSLQLSILQVFRL